MGGSFSAPVWPNEIYSVECPRQKVFEHLFEPSSIADWLLGELRSVEAVRDGEVAPGLLLTTADGISYIEFLTSSVDEGGVGTQVSWRFYWNHPPNDKPPRPAEWIKNSFSFKNDVTFELADSLDHPGRTKVIRSVTNYSHSKTRWLPTWALRMMTSRPDHGSMVEAAESKWAKSDLPSDQARAAGKTWPFHTVEARTPTVEARTPTVEATTPTVEATTPNVEAKTPTVE